MVSQIADHEISQFEYRNSHNQYENAKIFVNRFKENSLNQFSECKSI